MATASDARLQASELDGVGPVAAAVGRRALRATSSGGVLGEPGGALEEELLR